MSGYFGEAEGWRWIEGLMAIFTGVLWIVCTILVPETYIPVLLRRRAAKLSKLTGKVYMSKLDISKTRRTMAQQFKVALSRPWILLFREPIVFLTSIYMAIVYGTLYSTYPLRPGILKSVSRVVFEGHCASCDISFDAEDGTPYAFILDLEELLTEIDK